MRLRLSEHCLEQSSSAGSCPPCALHLCTEVLSYCPCPAAEPQDEFFSTFYTSYLPNALYFDSKQSSHPLSMDPGASHAPPAGRLCRHPPVGRPAAPFRRGQHGILTLFPPPLAASSWQPLAAAMNSTDKIESVFDAVMYDKGKAQCCAPHTHSRFNPADRRVTTCARKGRRVCSATEVMHHWPSRAIQLGSTAGAAVLRMLRAWANRDNRELPLPTYETIPGATPAQVQKGAEGLGRTALDAQPGGASLRLTSLHRQAAAPPGRSPRPWTVPCLPVPANMQFWCYKLFASPHTPAAGPIPGGPAQLPAGPRLQQHAGSRPVGLCGG